VRRALVLPIVLAAIAAGAPTAAQDARAAVEAFVARVWDVQISDLVIDQSLTLYHPDGQRRVSGGEQRMLFKLPQRQRVETELAGQLIERVLPGAGDRHRRTLLVKGARDRAADSAARAGDERGLARQVEHWSLLAITLCRA